MTPFAKVMRSGTTSQRSTANHSPHRPKPAITSSAISTMPNSSQISRTTGEIAVGRHEDAVGAHHRSRMIAATVCAPSTMRTPRGARAPGRTPAPDRGVERRPVGVRAPVAHDARHARLARPAPRLAGERDRTRRRAVIAAVGAPAPCAGRCTGARANRVLVGLRTAVREEHRRESPGARSAMSRARLAATSTANGDTTVQSLAACSWIAATSRGCWWPMFTLTNCEPRSR